MTHNQAYVGEEVFAFPEQYLLLNINSKIEMIKLFDMGTKDLRLVRYHVDTKS